MSTVLQIGRQLAVDCVCLTLFGWRVAVAEAPRVRADPIAQARVDRSARVARGLVRRLVRAGVDLGLGRARGLDLCSATMAVAL